MNMNITNKNFTCELVIGPIKITSAHTVHTRELCKTPIFQCAKLGLNACEHSGKADGRAKLHVTSITIIELKYVLLRFFVCLFSFIKCVLEDNFKALGRPLATKKTTCQIKGICPHCWLWLLPWGKCKQTSESYWAIMEMAQLPCLNRYLIKSDKSIFVVLDCYSLASQTHQLQHEIHPCCGWLGLS